MNKTASINVDNLKKVVGEVYGEVDSEKIGRIFEEYSLGGNIVFSRDTFADGQISVPYRVKYATGATLQGKLLFSDDGTVSDGLGEVIHQIHTEFGNFEDRLSASISQFLIALAFGPNELKSKFSDQEAKWFEGAKALYQCYESGGSAQSKCYAPAQKIKEARLAEDNVQRDTNNNETAKIILFAKQLLEKAKTEARWYNSWDPNDFSGIINEYSNRIAALPDVTKEESKTRLVEAEGMISRVLDTKSGAMACVKLNECGEVTKEAECGSGYKGTSQTTYYRYVNGIERIVRIIGELECEKVGSRGEDPFKSIADQRGEPHRD